MDSLRSDVSALQLAAELVSDTSASPSPPQPTFSPASEQQQQQHARKHPLRHAHAEGAFESAAQQHQKRSKPLSQLSRLLEDQRRFAMYDGESASLGNATRNDTTQTSSSSSPSPQPALRTSAALQAAVMRWGTMHEDKLGLHTGSCSSDKKGNDSDASSRTLRYSWRLMAAEQRSASSSDTTSHPWALGQRWERSDDLAQARVLLQAVHQEENKYERGCKNEEDDADTRTRTTFYRQGLKFCTEAARGSATLPARLSLPPAASSASCDTLAFFTFTEDEYGALPQAPPTSTSASCATPSTFAFNYASSCYLCWLWARFGNPIVVVDRWNPTTASRGAVGENSTGGDAATAGLVPTVEQACAEYSRVTTGVLRQRQQRLLHAVLAQQQQQQQYQSKKENAATTTTTTLSTSTTTTPAALAGSSTTAHASTPFVASFDRYALLHASTGSTDVKKEGEEGKEEDSASAPLSSLSPTVPHSATAPPPPQGDVIPLEKSASNARCTSSVAAPSQAPPPHVSPAQRLTHCITPNPWYNYAEEVQRRADAAELLRCERATNIPYQQAVTQYLRLATAAAQALQRAACFFDDRDRAEQSRPQQQQQQPGEAGTPSFQFSVPPRNAFTVRLRGLPQVDPAAWRSAETTLRKAATEALGSAAAAAAALAVTTTSSQRSRKRPRPAVRRSATSARAAKRSVKDKEVLKGIVKQEEGEEETNGDDELGNGSSEDSQSSSEAESDDSRSESDAASDSASDDDDTDSKSSSSSSSGHEDDAEAAAHVSELGLGDADVEDKTHSRHLHGGTTLTDGPYRILAAFLRDVVPFRCTRLRVAAQAGWMLPPLPALPQSLTDRLEEKEVSDVAIPAAHDGRLSTSLCNNNSSSSNAVAPSESAGDAAKATDASARLRPILQDDEYNALRKISATQVCNRVVSHTGEAVLLSLPPSLPRLAREVEQEMERYLYDDSSAMMEVNPIAQSLLAEIRIAYTQNTYLQRYTARLEHVVEGLRKVEQECREAGRPSGAASTS